MPRSLTDILDRSLREEPLPRDDIRFLVSLEGPDLQDVFASARTLRERYFGRGVFLYGFVYFSTWCRNRCAFCLYRTGNDRYTPYRKSPGEVLEVSRNLAESGVHLIDLTMGEDALYHEQGFEPLVGLVRSVRHEVGLPVMISPGVVPRDVLSSLAGAGADWYACYQETHNRDLFARLRVGQDYSQRMNTKTWARDLGLLTEEGVLTGVGETPDDLATTIEAMRDLRCQQVRVMGFVNQAGTPMEGFSWPNRELAMIAALRLSFPSRLIPASLDVDGLAGLELRLQAGANVITSLIPPHSGLAGVSQHSLDIDEGNRSVKGVLPVLEKLGLEASTAEEYGAWVARERRLAMAQEGVRA
jgi:methylornithine synthase